MLTSTTLATDTTIPAITFTFELATGNTGVKTIIDPLLTTQDIASERARREFMDNGYTERSISFSTHRTDLKLNNIILVAGLKYKVISKVVQSDQSKVVTSIKGVRFE